MADLKIITEECICDKRHTRLVFTLGEIRHVVEQNHWDNQVIEPNMEVTLPCGKIVLRPIKVISCYKHSFVCYFTPYEWYKEELIQCEDICLIDREYRHNHEFDFYNKGKATLVIC